MTPEGPDDEIDGESYREFWYNKAHSVQSPADDRLSNLAPLVAVLVYGSVALSLFAVTGDPHVGSSFPIVFALIGMLVALCYEVRYLNE